MKYLRQFCIIIGISFFGARSVSVFLNGTHWSLSTSYISAIFAYYLIFLFPFKVEAYPDGCYY